MIRAVLLLSLFCLHLSQCLAQPKLYSTTKGHIVFFSEAPLEDISAENKAAVSLINTANNEIVVRVPIDQFDFPNKLMQEHFNENYMESDKYPTATFKGKINEAIPWEKPGSYPASATGILTIHGKDATRTLKGMLVVGEKAIRLDTRFVVRLEDHNIKIPTLVFNKIAEQIDVKCRFDYRPYKRK